MILTDMKILNGSELAGFIKERQAKQVRSLIQSRNIQPKLAIIKTVNDPVIETYVRLKQVYGADIGIEVEIFDIDQTDVMDHISRINDDESVHGLIVQLPLDDNDALEEVLNSVDVSKDVDGLANNSEYTPATPLAISWLIDGYNVALEGRKVAIVGRGRLVGAPLQDLLNGRSIETTVFEEGVEDLPGKLQEFEVVISATGQPGLIHADMISRGAVVIDAGVATTGAKTVGDFSDDMYDRDDLTITPKKGGVGPLTVCALFENLIKAVSS